MPSGNWFPVDSPRTKDTQRFNQYGGSVGGPILHDKLFAFFAYETQRNNSQSIATGWYATPQFIQNAATPNSVASKLLGFPGVSSCLQSHHSGKLRRCRSFRLRNAEIPRVAVSI